MDSTMNYIRVTDKNLHSKDAVYDAVVVANYGDPGLDEDYHADILSRFVICKIESANRTLTADKYKNMLVVVKRPESLWINYQGGFLNAPINQRRTDASLNVNVGIASNYSANAISRINNPYYLGEKLKIKLIKTDEGTAYLKNSDYMFTSECFVWDSSSNYYGSWHTQGLNSHPYIAANNGANNLRVKTIEKTENGTYRMVINKSQYEAMSLSLFPNQASYLVSLFSNASSFGYYYDANGGYAFSSSFSLPLNFVRFEDMNVGGKERSVSTNCIPLVVAAPNTFTVPKSRNSGTVNYIPTYIEKAN